MIYAALIVGYALGFLSPIVLMAAIIRKGLR